MNVEFGTVSWVEICWRKADRKFCECEGMNTCSLVNKHSLEVNSWGVSWGSRRKFRQLLSDERSSQTIFVLKNSLQSLNFSLRNLQILLSIEKSLPFPAQLVVVPLVEKKTTRNFQRDALHHNLSGMMWQDALKSLPSSPRLPQKCKRREKCILGKRQKSSLSVSI